MAKILISLSIFEWKWKYVIMIFFFGLPEVSANVDRNLGIGERLMKRERFLPVKETYTLDRLIRMHVDKF